MDQKNTIVKCFAKPDCLFNHNGVCDNYVINIGADGSCQEYVETESSEEFIELEGLNYQKVKFNRKLFQLCAKCIHSLTPAEYEFSPACCFSEDGSIRLSGNCPHASQELRGQRAKGNFFDDMMDVNDKHLGEPATIKIPDPKDMDIHFVIQNAQVNIRDLVPECDLPVCDWSCKHAFRTGPTFNPELWCEKMQGKPARGLFCSDYEEEIDEV